MFLNIVSFIKEFCLESFELEFREFFFFLNNLLNNEIFKLFFFSVFSLNVKCVQMNGCIENMIKKKMFHKISKMDLRFVTRISPQHEYRTFENVDLI